MDPAPIPELDLEGLRCEIRKEYAEVATHPGKGTLGINFRAFKPAG